MTTAPAATAIRGLRILVVEDSFLVAQDLARMVSACGCVVVGPAPSATRAIELVERSGCDGAILDINLGDEHAGTIAERLVRSRTPFIFVTGYGRPTGMLDERLAARTLTKPVQVSELCSAMIEAFGRGDPTAAPGAP